MATDLKAELEKSVSLLKTLRDEARVKLHLAGMDAKSKWKELEPHLDAVEDAAKQASDASHAAVVKGVESLKAFLKGL
jgi:hypothetical protein